MARIYLGGPSAERELVKADAKKLLEAGHYITEPWWERVHEARSRRGYASDADVPDDYMAESAARNEEGLLFAEAVVLRMRTQPDASQHNRVGGPSSGLAYELGFIKGWVRAYVRHLRLIFIIGHPQRFIGIWTAPKPIIVPDIEAVIAQLPPPVA